MSPSSLMAAQCDFCSKRTVPHLTDVYISGAASEALAGVGVSTPIVDSSPTFLRRMTDLHAHVAPCELDHARGSRLRCEHAARVGRSARRGRSRRLPGAGPRR